MRNDFNITDPSTFFPPTAKITLRFLAISTGNLTGRNVGGARLLTFPLLTDSAIHIENTTSLSSINDFFYDDPTIAFTPLQDHELAQSPRYPIIRALCR